MQYINSFITMRTLPPLSSKFPKEKVNMIISAFQQQHYTDHSSFYSTINSLNKGLNISQIKIGISNLFFNNIPTFNDFAQNNQTDHYNFYKSANIIAEALVTGGYGVVPTIMSTVTNLQTVIPNINTNDKDKQEEYFFLNVNKFITQEYFIHQMFARYFNILIGTLNKTPIPQAGSG